MSPAQIANLRRKAAREIEKVFSTTILLAGIEIPAARWRSSSEVTDELGGLLSAADLTLRVRREILPERITLVPLRTTLQENGNSYRLEKLVDCKGDPCLILLCKAI